MKSPLTIDAHGQAWSGDEPLDLRFSPGKLAALISSGIDTGRWRSSSAFARSAGMSPQNLERLVSGRRPDPRTTTLSALVMALGCAFEDLLE